MNSALKRPFSEFPLEILRDLTLAEGAYIGETVVGIAGAALVFGNLCYFQTADSRWKLFNADLIVCAGNVRVGMCVLAAAGDGSATKMLLSGFINAASLFPTLNIGLPAYMGSEGTGGESDKVGNVQLTIPGAGRVPRIAGWGVTADILHFLPQIDAGMFPMLHAPGAELIIRTAEDAVNAIRITDAGYVTIVNIDTSSGLVTFPYGIASVLQDPDDGGWNGDATPGYAGAALAFGDLCYFAAADSRWELADADAAATAGPLCLGICVLAAAGDGSVTKMLLRGMVRADSKFPTLTIGAPVYVGVTAGEVQVAAPSGAADIIRIVGHGLTADVLLFAPSPDWMEVG